MKYIKHLIILLAAAVLTVSCADEGPEALGTFKVDVQYTNITPYSVEIEITVPDNPDNLITGVQNVHLKSVVGDEYISLERISDDNSFGIQRYKYRNYSLLEPDTEYRLECQGILANEYGNKYDGWSDHIGIDVENNIFRTLGEDAVDEMLTAESWVKVVSDRAASILITIPEDIKLHDKELFVGTSPDPMSNFDFIVNYYGGDGYFNDVSEKSFTVELRNLKPDTKYYFALRAHNVSLASNFSDKDLGERVIKLSENNFTTQSDGFIEEVCKINVTERFISPTNFIAELSFDKIQVASQYYYAINESDYPTDYDYHGSNNYFNENGTAIFALRSLSTGTKYYYTIFTDLNLDGIEYNKVVAARGTFTTPADKATTPDCELTVVSLSASEAVFNIKLPKGFSPVSSSTYVNINHNYLTYDSSSSYGSVETDYALSTDDNIVLKVTYKDVYAGLGVNGISVSGTLYYETPTSPKEKVYYINMYPSNNSFIIPANAQ
ncbi:MAG: hypothetical protein K2F91_02755 [Muribaculaceae bacterium]|nr:hypothetical protein [Muribaculaceae bacterium]